MIAHIDDTTGNASRVESVVTEPVIAAIAAHAATSVAGVTRLEPGLPGLVVSLARTARQRIKDLEPAPTEGVHVTVHDPGADGATVRVEVDLVVSGQDQVAAVGRAVQRAVSKAITEQTGLRTSAVSVTVLDIDDATGGA